MDATATATTAKGTNEAFTPKIAAFLCNWCSYAGADLAGMSRMAYPSNIKVMKVPCSGKVDPLFVLKAFEGGADMVLVSGCHPGDCHYSTGNYHARRKLPTFRALLEFMGIDSRRFQMSWVSAAEGGKWAKVVSDVTALAEELGPFEYFARISDNRKNA